MVTICNTTGQDITESFSHAETRLTDVRQTICPFDYCPLTAN